MGGYRLRLWQYATGGSVASGIAVAGGAVYSGGNDYKVYALRASDGSEFWSFATGGPGNRRSRWPAGPRTSAATTARCTR